ncbi:hypothetical protein M885DRAFT_248670 [Pelagophyceae sp. CCMP2097]|nr:hypothetical protein M885DRAFT_248670 [Pelagophyceae sp. CCMP2097]
MTRPRIDSMITPTTPCSEARSRRGNVWPPADPYEQRYGPCEIAYKPHSCLHRGPSAPDRLRGPAILGPSRGRLGAVSGPSRGRPDRIRTVSGPLRTVFVFLDGLSVSGSHATVLWAFLGSSTRPLADRLPPSFFGVFHWACSGLSALSAAFSRPTQPRAGCRRRSGGRSTSRSVRISGKES